MKSRTVIDYERGIVSAALGEWTIVNASIYRTDEIRVRLADASGISVLSIECISEKTTLTTEIFAARGTSVDELAENVIDLIRRAVNKNRIYAEGLEVKS